MTTNDEMRNELAKSKVFRAKLDGIAGRLEELDDLGNLTPAQDREYDALVTSYKGTAMAWRKQRKGAGLAYDMITVTWS